ncbi:hypothetical protein GCM10009559_01520 [Pseudonocardia zijingensis]|uniref:Uncharacterized protein n=1 Tax=Pseudonocardia zijingensis TaxID=153376 RepID=A0ABN1NYF2_9PSEU
MRAGGERHVGRCQQPGELPAVAHEPDERHRQPGGPPLERGPARTVPRHHQPHPVTRRPQRGDGVDAALRVLLRREPAAVHEEGVGARGQPGPQAGVVVQRRERHQVDAERHLGDVARPDPVELGPRERRGADDRVVRGGHARVRHVGDAPGGRGGEQELREQPVEPLVRQHHARHAVAGGPRAEPA